MDFIVAAWSRQVSRAKNKLKKNRENDVNARSTTTGSLGRKASLIPFLSKRRSTEPEDVNHDVDVENDEAVWRKTILMGEKCQLPDYTGAIYYDSEGRMLEEPRTPCRSPLPSFLFAAAAAAATPEKNGMRGSGGGGAADH